MLIFRFRINTIKRQPPGGRVDAVQAAGSGAGRGELHEKRYAVQGAARSKYLTQTLQLYDQSGKSPTRPVGNNQR